MLSNAEIQFLFLFEILILYHCCSLYDSVVWGGRISCPTPAATPLSIHVLSRKLLVLQKFSTFVKGRLKPVVRREHSTRDTELCCPWRRTK